MRFGEMLAIWLDYIGLTQKDFAPIVDKHPEYLASIKRGRIGDHGVTSPSAKIRDQIYRGLEKAAHLRLQKKIKMRDDIFWAGPQLPVFQQRIAAFGTKPMETIPAQSSRQGIELKEIFETRDLAHDGRTLTANEKSTAWQIVNAYLSNRW
jgi:hypothetical protein